MLGKNQHTAPDEILGQTGNIQWEGGFTFFDAAKVTVSSKLLENIPLTKLDKRNRDGIFKQMKW